MEVDLEAVMKSKIAALGRNSKVTTYTISISASASHDAMRGAMLLGCTKAEVLAAVVEVFLSRFIQYASDLTGRPLRPVGHGTAGKHAAITGPSPIEGASRDQVDAFAGPGVSDVAASIAASDEGSG